MAVRRSWVITGGAGFVGSNLVATLAQQSPEDRLIVIDDLTSGTFANLVGAFERRGLSPFSGEFIASSCGEIDWDSLLDDAKPQAVFHLAAITDTTVSDERRMIETNAEEFRPLLWSCIQSATPLAYASSAATYGTPPQVASREPFPITAAGSPNNVYGFSKWLMECDHRAAARAHKLESGQEPWVVGLRYFNVFGPGEDRKGSMASMAFQIARQLADGNRPRLFTDGDQSRDQVHVDDVVACTLAAGGLGSKKRPAPGVYNVGSGRSTSFNALVDAVRRGMGIDGSDRPTEYFAMPEKIRAFYQDYTSADMSETQSGLGFSPTVDPIAGIEQYANWLASRR